MLAGLLLPAALNRCAADELPLRGGVLILKSERVLAGDIERVPDGFLVRRNVGELWLPAEEAKCLCAD
jgi:hypothetical protein